MADVADILPKVAGLDRLRFLTRGRPEVRVAVLDGSVDAATVGGLIALCGAVDHGTLVSSIIAGSRDGSIPGIAPGCTVLPIPVFSGDASGGCSQDQMADAIEQAIANGAHIVNISAAQQADTLSLSLRLSSALQSALEKDVLVVAATGNQGCACDTIPASVPGVLAVGAHGPDGAPLVSSNWGAGHRNQGVLAPGLAIAGACVGGGVCSGSGTSFATAVTSGVAALLMSLQVQLGRNPSGRRTRRILLQSSDEAIPQDAEILSKYMAGRLDASRAIDLVLKDFMKTGAEGAIMDIQNEPFRLQEAEGSQEGGGADVALVSLTEAQPRSVLPAGEQLRLSGCGCGGGHGDCKCGGGSACTCGAKAKPQLVYAIGRLGVSFISMSRRDAVWRSIHGAEAGKAKGVTPEVDLRPIDNASLRALLKREPWHAQSIVWTLSRSEIPMYAIMAAGPFAERTYQWMVEQWSDPQVEFISLPGVIAGQMTLYDGMNVDVVVPDLRGMYSWNTTEYSQALSGSPTGEADKKGVRKDEPDGARMRRFLSKIYYRIRNRGLSPEERALNAAATNAFNLSDLMKSAGRDGLAFRDVSVEKSPFNRPGSEYYDVLLTFFSPNDRLGQAMLVARFTIDVSDTVPVIVGEPVEWYEY